MNPKDISIPAVACGKCGQKFFLMGAEAWARQQAEMCCNYTCQHCGREVPQYWSACEDCQEMKRLLKAQEVPVNGHDMVFCDGFSNEGFIPAEDLDDELADMESPPAYVWATEFTPLHLNAENILQSVLDDHWEGAEFTGSESFIEFVERFNAQQKDGTYRPDYCRVMVLDPVRFQDLLARAREMEAKAGLS